MWRAEDLRLDRSAAPHAVAVHDVTTDEHDQPVPVMEYVPSRSLAAAPAGRDILPPAAAAYTGALTPKQSDIYIVNNLLVPVRSYIVGGDRAVARRP